MPRITSLVETGFLSSDSQITTVTTDVFAVEIAWQNAAIGENVWLKDTDDGSDVKETGVVFATAAGTIQLSWAQGKRFDTGLYLDIGASSGQILVSIQYKT
ncbi:MAG: hypothetical protein KDH96_03220 [Candidatus Riesia sp.]|nr:hypothetical protein [Candidatus Riesia sp.]